MKNDEVKIIEYLTNDYIYIPYIDKNELNLKNKSLVYKDDYISSFLDNIIYSPISGRPYGLSEIYKVDARVKCLIIENDFKDIVQSQKSLVKDIYDLSKDKVKALLKIDSKCVSLKINKSSKSDIRDSYVLKEHITEILDTLNLIDITYDDVKVEINIEKSDYLSYQTLLSYMGTYFNIDVTFKTTKSNTKKELNVYDALDMYNTLKNTFTRDYIYISFETKNETFIVKTKKYSNLQEILSYLEIKTTKVIVNSTYTIENTNLLLDDDIYLISVL